MPRAIGTRLELGQAIMKGRGKLRKEQALASSGTHA